MTDSETRAGGDTARGGAGERLDSWKRIAAYLKRDVSTVQRWERREGMPVHRHVHDKLGSVFAFRSELDEWWEGRRARLAAAGEAERDHGATTRSRASPPRAPIGGWRLAASVLAVGLLAAVAAGAWLVGASDRFWRDPLAEARFIRAAEFTNAAQAASISRDGNLVAFLAEHDGRIDAWLGEFGGDRYRNLTAGAVRDLVNPSVRTLGFAPDASLVSIWTRAADGSEPDDVNLLAAPTAGGSPEPYMPSVAELDWSPDGRRLVYHTTAPGDPLFVREPGPGGTPTDRQIYVAPPGVHAHFPVWSPDGAFIYFVRGVPREHWDVWRIRPSGAGLERITRHDSQVAHPVLLDRRTLLYLATDATGAGPWIYSLDVERRVPHRVSSGLETYTSLAASGDGRRLVATTAQLQRSLWRMPLAYDGSELVAGEPELLLADGATPRIGPEVVLFTTVRGSRQGVWTLADGTAHEVWSAEGARIVGAPAVTSDGRRIAFAADEDGRTRLYVVDGYGAPRVLTDSLALRGSPAWWPDGESIVWAALRGGEPRLMRIFLNGEPPVPLVPEYSIDPVWAPGGEFLVYSGADVGTTFPLRAAETDGRPHPLPGLMLTRGARRVAFVNDRPTLIYLSGEVGHKDLWLMDLRSGNQRLLTQLPHDFVIGDFDVAADGTALVLDRVQENSRLALIERPQ